MNKTAYTFMDLFAGIGGIRLGFERAGAKCVWSCEWDKECQEMYETNFRDKPAGDITRINASEIPDHDILTAGFPCQSFSIIGKRNGLKDTRGVLFFEIARILKAKRPQAFLLENVKQLTTIDQGTTFKTILKTLKELGYFVHWKVLNGLHFGVPQKRERVFIVGFEKNYPFRFPLGSYRGKGLQEVLEKDENVGRKYFVSERIRKKLEAKVKTKPEVPTIWHENKSGNIGIHEYSCALRANASYNYLLVNGVRRLTPREMLRLQGFPEDFRIVVSDSAMRQQAGNSVVVPVVESVAREVIKALKQPLSERNVIEVDAEQQPLLSFN